MNYTDEELNNLITIVSEDSGYTLDDRNLIVDALELYRDLRNTN